MSLSQKALLVSLNISQWTGRRLDKRATGTVEAKYATQSKVGNYTKKLLPAAKQLEEIQRIAGSIRTFFYEQTLPWYSDGSRIISAKNYLDFTGEFRKRKGEFERAVTEFLAAYPDLKEQARLKLGNLFSETEYPTTAHLEHTFSCDVSFAPLPDVSDFRVQVLDEEKTAFLQKIAQTESQAMRECWNRLHDVVSKAASRMADPKAILRDSLVENIQEICTLLPRLNINDDPALESMRQHVESVVAGISTDVCRTSEHARQDATRALSDITSKMSAFMGSAA